MSLVETPWLRPLEDFVSAAKNDLIVVTPFFSSSIMREVIAKCNSKVKIRLLLGKITAQTLAERTTDPDILKEILHQRPDIECRCIKNLHAKVVAIDVLSKSARAIVTSSNLTREGLFNNVELGVIVEGALAKKICKRLLNYWDDPNAELLSEKKFSLILNRTKKMKKTSYQRDIGVSIGGYVTPKGMDLLKPIIAEHTVNRLIKRLEQREGGRGYLRKKKDICKVRDRLCKVTKYDLDESEFKNFFSIIDRWTGAIRAGNLKRLLVENDAKKINRSLRLLLDESMPVSDRIDSLLFGDYKLSGAALGIISAILFVSNFDRYNIYNKRVFRGLFRVFGSEIHPVHDGATYEFFNSAVMRFRNLFGLQPMETDWVLFWLGE